jgi:hypothetical protein
MVKNEDKKDPKAEKFINLVPDRICVFKKDKQIEENMRE